MRLFKRKTGEGGQPIESTEPARDAGSLTVIGNDNGYTRPPAIGKEHVRRANTILQKYKAGKANLENRLIQNEQFWKLRQWDSYNEAKNDQIKPASAWLWQAIVSKHADYSDAYPSPNILPRMADDKSEADRLSSIIPIIIEQCRFRRTYDDVSMYKLKQGTGVYGVFWDSNKENGVGDIAITKVDILKLFWEPGITNIQDSPNVFFCDLVSNDVLKQKYPDLGDKVPGDTVNLAKYIYDDTVDTSDKSVVVEWYYKKYVEGRTVLHFVKYVGETVLYASENDTDIPTTVEVDPTTLEPVEVPTGESRAVKGWYTHGLYPFVFDVLYGIEGSPCGYGYTDIGRDIQREIDVINQAIVKNTLCGAKPRYFIKSSGGVNEKEFADWSRDFIHTDGSLGTDAIRTVDYNPIQGNYMEFLESKINEIKEITGNRDVSNGSTVSGVTAATAIAALQESGGKMSRDGISTTYDAFNQIVYFVIELMREFYDVPRYYRILGQSGQEEFTMYQNSALVPQWQGEDFGVDMGYRVPEFDIQVTAEKSSSYKRMEQNELAIQLYNLGIFAPQNAPQALMLLETMDFSGKDNIIQRVTQNGTLEEQLIQYQQLALSIANKYDPAAAELISQQIIQTQGGAAVPMVAGNGEVDLGSSTENGEGKRMESAREESIERSQPK